MARTASNAIAITMRRWRLQRHCLVGLLCEPTPCCDVAGKDNLARNLRWPAGLLATAVVFIIAVVSLAATATPPDVKQGNREKTSSSKKVAAEKQPEKAKKEQNVLTPEEAIKQRPKEKVNVQYKVASVEVTPLDGVKVEGFAEGPCIRLYAGAKFSVLLKGMASHRIVRLGIEPGKHFNGKSVRVTGYVVPDVVEGPPFNIIVDDLDQFEVVQE